MFEHLSAATGGLDLDLSHWLAAVKQLGLIPAQGQSRGKGEMADRQLGQSLKIADLDGQRLLGSDHPLQQTEVEVPVQQFRSWKTFRGLLVQLALPSCVGELQVEPIQHWSLPIKPQIYVSLDILRICSLRQCLLVVARALSSLMSSILSLYSCSSTWGKRYF